MVVVMETTEKVMEEPEILSIVDTMTEDPCANKNKEACTNDGECRPIRGEGLKNTGSDDAPSYCSSGPVYLGCVHADTVCNALAWTYCDASGQIAKTDVSCAPGGWETCEGGLVESTGLCE